jgi:DNA modification methylase
VSDLYEGLDAPKSLRRNHLYYGDNLTIMREMPSNIVDLIYLDPPFNSDRTYNLIYRQLTGLPLPEQEEAFVDTWTLDAEKEEMVRNMPMVLRQYGCDEGLVRFWDAWIGALRNTDKRLLAYLVYMTYRLFEMRRILKPTGSIYLHCDATASHYIKIMMDSIFGAGNFRNEIIWKRQSAHSDAKSKFPVVTDSLLFYGNGKSAKFTPQYGDHDPEYIDKFYRFDDGDGRGRYRLGDMSAPKGGGMSAINKTTGKPNGWHIYKGFEPPMQGWRYSPETLARLDSEGRVHFPTHKDGTFDLTKRLALKRYLEEQEGSIITNVWTDISPLGGSTKKSESLGYPTQKPIALLKRIIQASTEEEQIVFDPFCGCGTAIYAAHLTNRKWIGCDIAILSVRIVQDVLKTRYGLEEGRDYSMSGVPLTEEGARDLFMRDPRQFQHWVVEMAGGFANKKHSGDLGIDGRLYFETIEGQRAVLKSMVISVKGGKLTPAYVRELRGTLAREDGTEMAGFLSLESPTKGMVQEAASAGMYHYAGVDYPRLQLRTAADLLAGRMFDTPTRVGTLHTEKQGALALAGKHKK